MTTGRIIDGKAIAAEMRAQVARDVEALRAQQNRVPGLAVVRVGEDPASRIYVSHKQKASAEVGIHSTEYHLSDAASQQEVLDTVLQLNEDASVHGILVQLPLPDHLDAAPILRAISPEKDVDGLHPENVGRLWLGQPGFVACTPAGILELIRRTGTELKGLHAVVVGRSHIVGKPTIALLLQEHATVTVCHSRTQDLAAVCRQADVLVAAVGKARLVRGDWIKPGAVVIDVGINRSPENKLIGDVDFDAARKVAGHITPVPGGVGPMTIAMLLVNTLTGAKRSGNG